MNTQDIEQQRAAFAAWLSNPDCPIDASQCSDSELLIEIMCRTWVAAIELDWQGPGEPEKPSGYAFRYHSYDGGTVIRFNNGTEVNGSRPIEAVPYWFAPQPTDPVVKDSLTVAEPVKEVTEEQIADIVRDHLTAVYACNRTWSAWSYGTMSQDDFTEASETEMADEIAAAIVERYGQPEQPAASAEPCLTALAELVACKDLKTRAEALEFAGFSSSLGENWEAEFKRLRADYIKRQPAAWDAARAALAGTAPISAQPSVPVNLIKNAIRKALSHQYTSDNEAFSGIDRDVDVIANAVCAALGDAPPADGQAQQDADKVDAPVQVGNIRFGKGVATRLVIEAAQRHYAYMNTPEREAERIKLAEYGQRLLSQGKLLPTHLECYERMLQLEADKVDAQPVAWLDPSGDPDYNVITAQWKQKMASTISADGYEKEFASKHSVPLSAAVQQDTNKVPVATSAEPVAVVGSDFNLFWAGSGPIAPLVKRHGIKVGTRLYTAPVSAQPSVPDISDDDLMRVFWKHFRSFRSSASAVTYTKWKDGIDIDVMSTPMLAYSRELLTMLAPTPPVDEQAQRPMEWPTMPPSKGGSGAAFDSGYAEGWSKCLMDCKNVVRQAQQEDQL